jgi:uncharacterized membrane protein (UPF0182 family)
VTFPSAPSMPHLHIGFRPKGWVVGLVLAIAVIVILLATVGTSIWVDLLFYREVHFTKVFTTVLTTRIVLFFLVGVVGAAVITTNLVLGYVLRPAYVPMSPEQQQLEGYRVTLSPLRKPLTAVVALILGVLFGVAGQHDWRVVLLRLHGKSFGQKDPLFHRDLSYYAFDLPFERTVVSFGFTMLVLALVAAALTHYFYGGIRLQTRGEKVSAAARAHLSVLVGLFLVLKAIAYYLDRYGLTLSSQGGTGTTGAGYTDVHATLPAKTILIFIALICAGLFFANAVRRGAVLAAAGLGTMVFAALVVGGLVPFLVQQFHVKPNAINLEAKYINSSIDATRQAYQLEPTATTSSGTTGTVATTTFNAPSAPAASAVTATTSNVANARLLDPNELQETFEQLQQIRSYYSFPQALDVDRYTIAGQEQSYVVATRDVNLAGLQGDQRNWVNEHLVYTHGQGFVAAETSQVDANGRPIFAVKGIPATASDGVSAPPIAITEPRIYYGELSPTYSIVDTTQPEVDGTGAANYHYAGSGGVKVGSKLGTRLALALHFKDYNLLFSSAVTKNSKILYYRDPRQRVAKVAPWLTLDGDPYPAVVDGRITWIVDGYTTSDEIPYSQRVSLSGATTTAASNASNVAQQTSSDINYIRNSVKATVDAYTGKVTLYAFENGVPDPVLRTWESIFPGTVQPESAMSPDLRAHLRYPEDLFNVQRNLLAKYHVSDPKAFFQGTDFWQVAADPVDGSTSQAPYYEELTLPGQTTPEFDLTTSLTYRGRPNLAAFVAVSSDPADYGTMHVLQLPNDTVLQGPANVYASIKRDTGFAQQYSLLNTNGSTVISGNLLTLPVGGGLLFVEPFYTQAANNTGSQTSSDSFPLLALVVVVYGDKVGYAPTLAGALTAALTGASTTTTITGTSPPATGPSATPTPSATSTAVVAPGSVTALQTRVNADIAAVQKALDGGNVNQIVAAAAQLKTDQAALSAAEAPKVSTSPSASP